MESMEDIGPFEPCHSSANSFAVVYIPEVKNDLIPKISQKFDSLDEAHLFYNNYARESGFSTRINSSKKNKQGEIIRKEYVCYNEGVKSEKYTQQNSGKVIRKIGLTRVGCGARMHVVKDQLVEGFVVIQFEPGHNHPLTTPRKVHLLRSHRGVSHAKKALTRQLGGANVSIPQQMSLFEMEVGGLENVGCSLQDLYNAERDRRKMLEGHDANLLFEHFENEKHKNSSFMYSMEKDAEGMMTDCFWADATCRKSYQYFGDVVVFDTTYNTNRYNLIFAPILGVNHHGQTTLFGCAFLKHEKFENFEWLLKVGLNAMHAGPPKMIITDQCPTMTKANSVVLPNVLHMYCIWHIVSKFFEKIGALAYKQHYEEFKKCIWKFESPSEFEESWVQVVEKANLSTNEWLDAMYKIRDRWVPAYTRNIFSAHMTSSQRAKSSHNFFKRYVSRENTMLDFVTRFNRALSHIRHNELDLDHKDVNESPLLKTMRVMEKKMSELYTRHVFYKFQAEAFESGAYVLMRIFKDEHRTSYNVATGDANGSKGREVSVYKSSNYVCCSCKMFECDGIPCRHMVAYFNKKQVLKLPNEYILQRWTKSAKVGRVMDDFGGSVKEICDTPLLVTRNRLL